MSRSSLCTVSSKKKCAFIPLRIRGIRSQLCKVLYQLPSQVEHGPGWRLRRPDPSRRLPSHDRQQVDHQQVGSIARPNVQEALSKIHQQTNQRLQKWRSNEPTEGRILSRPLKLAQKWTFSGGKRKFKIRHSGAEKQSILLILAQVNTASCLLSSIKAEICHL